MSHINNLCKKILLSIGYLVLSTIKTVGWIKKNTHIPLTLRNQGSTVSQGGDYGEGCHKSSSLQLMIWNSRATLKKEVREQMVTVTILFMKCQGRKRSARISVASVWIWSLRPLSMRRDFILPGFVTKPVTKLIYPCRGLLWCLSWATSSLHICLLNPLLDEWQQENFRRENS